MQKRGPKGTVLFGPLAEKGAKQNRPLWLPFASLFVIFAEYETV